MHSRRTYDCKTRFYPFLRFLLTSVFQAGSVLPSTAVADIITAVRTYSDSVANTKYLAQPMARLDTVPSAIENAHEVGLPASCLPNRSRILCRC